MEVTLRYKSGEQELCEVEKCLAGSEVLPYWILWYPEDVEAKVKVRFIAIDCLEEVQLYGDSSEESTKSHLSVIKGGKDIGEF